MNKHAVNLLLCYLHCQSLDTDEKDPAFGYDKKKVSLRFWLFMIGAGVIIALLIWLKSIL